MVSSAWLGLEFLCPIGVCAKEEMCPHADQMTLVTDHTEQRRGSAGAIASRDVMVAQNAASEALKGLGQRRGGGGSPSP